MAHVKKINPLERDKELTVLLPGQRAVSLPPGKTLLEISQLLKQSYPYEVVAAMVDNRLSHLNTIPVAGSKIEFIDLGHREGMRIYRRSLTFLLIHAAGDLFPSSRVMVEHSLGKGLYCEFKGEKSLTRQAVTALEERMLELVEADIPFVRERVSREEASTIFASQGDEDKVTILKYRPKEHVDLYSLGHLKDYLYGYLVPSTGCLQHFALKFYMPGLILRFPDETDPMTIPPYEEQPRLFEVFREAESWGKILGVDTVGTLNDLIASGEGNNLIRVAEALHEKKVAEIADTITGARRRVRLILIAGPSSSGKTSFSQRLRIQLQVNGLKPLPISLDDYFIDREKTPLNEKGEPDFESLNAVDVDLFNEHLQALIRGEEVEVPSYNFKTGKREYRVERLRLEEGFPLMVEGIHGLNEKLTDTIPRGSKFKVYTSCLTSLNVDRHNRIHTTDTRLLRRMVRDNQFRSIDAVETIRRWPLVREGEEKNIFPFQEDADVMFNSALIYELAVLKHFAESLLTPITEDFPEHVEAKRLLHFLQYFLPLEPEEVPTNSILKEFIGRSCFF